MVELATLPNPFRENVVQNAWQTPADVPEIHDDVFRACLFGIDSAAKSVPDSLVIFGPAGSGKTHLLTRLQRHLADTAGAAPDRVLRCVFVFVRLQTSPSLLWQHVRRRFASDLMHREQGVTQLQRLVAHQMSARDGGSPRLGVMELRVLSQADQDTLTGHLDDVARDLDLPRDLTIALQHLVCNRFVRDASAWLTGDSLPDAVLAQLGVGPDTSEDREEAARGVVTALCRLAGETLPITFCFDQVEALRRSLDDRDAFYRFGRMASELFDGDPNVFLITCLQSAYVEDFHDTIRQADRDRMARRQITLEPLTRAQVEKLAITRLESVPELSALSDEPFFPLTRKTIDDLARETPCVPRTVLAQAARAFEAAQHSAPPPPTSMDTFLRRQLSERLDEATKTSNPAETENILVSGLETLAAHPAVKAVHRNVRDADFMLEGTTKVAAIIRNEMDGRSLAPRLKKLLETVPRKDGARSVILRDPRHPLSRNAVKTREHLSALREKGVSLIEPTVEALAALAALNDILADAASGDLANDGAPLSQYAVLDWLRAAHADLLLEPVQELVDALLSGEATEQGGDEEDLAALLAEERVLALDGAAERLGVPLTRLLEIARQRSDRFLVLEGPPQIIVDIAGVVSGVEG
jgi:hypothetical protein